MPDQYIVSYMKSDTNNKKKASEITREIGLWIKSYVNQCDDITLVNLASKRRIYAQMMSTACMGSVKNMK